MSWLHRLIRRGNMEQQLEKELRFHVEEHAANLHSSGVEPGEARRLAHLSLGGLEQVKEQCRDERGTRWLEEFWQDLAYSVRALRRRPGFTAIALLMLALGIGGTTVMFTIVNGVLLRPLAFPEPDRLVTVDTLTEELGETWGISNPDFRDAARESHSLRMAAWTYGGGTISGAAVPEYAVSRQISAELFPVLGASLVRGRAFSRAEDQPGAAPVIMIGYGLWQRRYAGSASAVGSTLLFEGKPYTIVGVAPPGLQLDEDADVFTPLGQNTEPHMQNRGARFLHVVARLRPGVAIGEAQSELALLARHLAEQFPGSNAGLSLLARPLQEQLVNDVRSTLWLLLAAVALVLLIACANIASLLLARAVSRERELAMRVALGAGRGRLVRQCLVESAVLSVTGGGLGVGLAFAALGPFLVLWPGTLPRAEEIHLDWRVLLFALAASLSSGLLFGLAPALRVPMRELDQRLRSGARGITGSSRRLQSAFVVAEIALAVVLLVSAGALGRALLRLSSLDPGLDAQNVLSARVALSPSAVASPAQIRVAWQEVLDRAGRVPGVRSAALSDIIPMRVGENSLPYRVTPNPVPPNQMPFALASSVTPNYLGVMGIPLRHGRFFNDHDRLGSQPVMVIDENLALHAFGEQNPVGKSLWIPAMGPGPIEIVGVVGHVRHWGLASDDQSRVRDQLYYPLAQVPDALLHFFSSVMSIAVRTTTPPLSIVGSLGRELRGVRGDQVLYEFRTMDQLVSASLSRQHFLLVLFGVFAGLALFLACVGLYGVLAYLTSQRIPELGLRVALGATARKVGWLVLRESMGMVLAGTVLGASAAAAASRILVRTVEGVRSDPATFVLVSATLVLAALAASWLPARRASRVDPVIALRQD
jgi:predicted permease